MISEYDVVRLKREIPEHNLPSGVRGTVLVVYDEPDLPPAYEIEFLDDQGKSIMVLTLAEEYVEKCKY